MKAAHKALNIKITWKQKQQTNTHTKKNENYKEKYCENKTQIKRKREKKKIIYMPLNKNGENRSRKNTGALKDTSLHSL